MIILDLVDPPTQSPPEVELWLAVLKRAVEDLAGHCLFEERVRIQQEITRWFTSQQKSQGSFEWTCQLLGIDSGATRRAILRRQQVATEDLGGMLLASTPTFLRDLRDSV